MGRYEQRMGQPVALVQMSRNLLDTALGHTLWHSSHIGSILLPKEVSTTCYTLAKRGG